MPGGRSSPLCLLVATQVVCKLVGVALNVLMMRTVGAKVFAVSSRLDMITSTILSIGRETMRMALLRCTLSECADYAQWKHSLFRMASQSSLIGACIGLVGIAVFTTTQDHGIATYRRAATHYCLSAILEMLCEPFIVYFMHVGSIHYRLAGEAGMAVLKALVLGYRVALKGDTLEQTVDAFGKCQLCLCTLLLAYYLALFYWSEQRLRPDLRLGVRRLGVRRLSTTGSSNKAPPNITLELYKQSALKFMVGKSDALVMNYLSPLDLTSQGVHSLVSSYVSLFPRIIQAPLEETGYLLFARTIDKAGEDEQRAAYALLSNVLKFDLLAGCVLVLFGVQYAGPVGRLIASDSSIAREARDVLSAACFLLPIMSMSGICEAFMNSTMGPVGMARMRNASIVLSVVSVVDCLVLGRLWGGVGLVLAAMVNFSLRLSIALGYVYFRPNPSKHLDLALKPATVRAVTVASGTCLLAGAVWGFGSAEHVSTGLAMGIGCLLPMTIRSEPGLVNLFVK